MMPNEGLICLQSESFPRPATDRHQPEAEGRGEVWPDRVSAGPQLDPHRGGHFRIRRIRINLVAARLAPTSLKLTWNMTQRKFILILNASSQVFKLYGDFGAVNEGVLIGSGHIRALSVFARNYQALVKALLQRLFLLGVGWPSSLKTLLKNNFQEMSSGLSSLVRLHRVSHFQGWSHRNCEC